ncbi:MAG: hypothetical protein HY842_03175 [Bacteroidetes bacterium]|nr:hypothetical protein [Bacteroidota bacterium]
MWLASSQGQDSLLLTKNFRFADGVYLSAEQLRANRPAYAWEAVEVLRFTNPQTSLTSVSGVFLKKEKRELPLDSVWAVSMDGIPSVRVPHGEINRELPTFAALKLRGKICYFTYPDWRTKEVFVAAYNPLNGRPFRQGKVKREQEVIIEKMLRFESGEVADFNVGNLLAWIQDDPLLVETLTELPPEEQQEKLFRCLLIYVDRNEAFLRGEGRGMRDGTGN